MMRKRRLLLAAGETAALGACSFSLEHGVFYPCRSSPMAGWSAQHAGHGPEPRDAVLSGVKVADGMLPS